MTQLTNTFDGITVTVRARRGADVWDEFVVKAKLPKEETAANSYRSDKFAEFVTATVSVSGELGFKWATVNSSADEMQAAYEEWCNLDPDLMVKWWNLIYDAKKPPLPEANTTPGNG